MPSPRPAPPEGAKRIGFVTIGQSPRDDVVPGMLPYLGPVQVLEAGALDGLGPEEVAALAPRGPEQVLVTRLRDGSPVTVDKELIFPRLQECVARLDAAGAAVIVLLCTGSFPKVAARALVLEPDRIVLHTVLAVARRANCVGVMVPAEDQINAMRARWRAAGVDPVVAAGSPYGPPQARLEAARQLAAAGAELVVLDCMGYTQAMKEEIAAVVRCPVLVAHEAVARLAGAWL